MNRLLSTEFFCLLKENSQTVSNDEMQQAYETFVKEVLTLNQSEADFKTIFRELNVTRIEFKTLQAQILCEQREKCA
ncbi:hypothetical protein [Dysgonomonas capnocytophagoides]